MIKFLLGKMIRRLAFLRFLGHHQTQKFQSLRSSGLRWYSVKTDQECFVEHLQGNDKGIAVINLNRPQAKNALSRKFLQEFRSSVEHLRYNEAVRVVVLRSLVDRVFCAGADLKL